MLSRTDTAASKCQGESTVQEACKSSCGLWRQDEIQQRVDDIPGIKTRGIEDTEDGDHD